MVIDFENEGTIELLAAIVRQAIVDYRAGYRHARHPDAGAFLRAAGLLREDGTIGYDGKAGRAQDREPHREAVHLRPPRRTRRGRPPAWLLRASRDGQGEKR